LTEENNPCAAVRKEVEELKAKTRNGNWTDRIIVAIAMLMGVWWLQNQYTTIQQVQMQIGDIHAKAARIEALQDEVLRRLIDVEKDIHRPAGER
jgi:hypothetical protein